MTWTAASASASSLLITVTNALNLGVMIIAFPNCYKCVFCICTCGKIMILSLHACDSYFCLSANLNHKVPSQQDIGPGCYASL